MLYVFERLGQRVLDVFYHKEMLSVLYKEVLALTWSLHVYGYMKYHMGAGEMTPRLTALATCSEDPGSVPRMHPGSQPPVNPIPEKPTPSSGLCTAYM